MKNGMKSFEVFCTKFVFVISAVMFVALSYWATKYKHNYGVDYASEKVYGSFDSFGINMLSLFIALFVLYGLQALLLRTDVETQKKRVRIFLIIDMIAVGIFAIVWVTGSHIMPSDDQLQVYLTSVEFTQGIYRDMEAYFYMCPQQYGLAFLYECIWWIWESYHFVQYINVVFLLMILFFGYQISDCLFDSPRINFYTVLIMNLFLPLTLYVNFVYGEVGTVAMSMCGIWAVFKWMKTGKLRYGVVAALAMTLALMVRLNMIIVVIAMVIVLLVFALCKKNWKACVVALALFVVPLGGIELVEFSYELRSGLEVGEGIPAVVNIAMGMQESWQGAGAYNAYNHQTFWNNGGDSQAAAQVAKDYIALRLEEFNADLGMMRYFYQSKIWEQWNVGCFGSLIMTNDFEAAPFPLAQEVYGGKLQVPVLNFMEYYLFVIYFGALVYSVYGIIFVKDLRKTILPMIVIGGMIFSLLWEAKARYVFPYIVLLLPAVAAGLHFCHTAVEKSVLHIKELHDRRSNG